MPNTSGAESGSSSEMSSEISSETSSKSSQSSSSSVASAQSVELYSVSVLMPSSDAPLEAMDDEPWLGISNSRSVTTYLGKEDLRRAGGTVGK